jgi:hypothetical protein
MVTVLLASAVPLMVGLLLLVSVPSEGLLMLGALGAAVSTVMLTALEALEVLPAASLALAVIECVPSLRAALGVKLQSPELLAVAVPNELAPSKTVTVLLASAVPLMVGLLLLVLLPLVGLLMLGALGAAVSTMMLTALEAVEVLLAASVAVAVIECVPSLKAVLGVKLQLPSDLAVVVPSLLVPS